MELWHPPHDEAERFSWWQPLVRVSRRVREARIPWPIHLDEFVLAGRVDRPVRPAIWVYQHRQSGGALLVDDAGVTYRYEPTPNAPAPGRFVESTLREAVHAAALPEVVEPVWYGVPSDTPVPADPPPGSDDAVDRHPAGRGRRGHLRLVSTGTG